MGSHAGGQGRECEVQEQSQATLLQLQSTALRVSAAPL